MERERLRPSVVAHVLWPACVSLYPTEYLVLFASRAQRVGVLVYVCISTYVYACRTCMLNMQGGGGRD